MSQDDKLFLAKVEASTSFEDGHYCVGLPFREKKPVLPNNKIQAVQRAKSLQGRFERNTEDKAEYIDFMEGLLRKKFAEPVPDTTTTTTTTTTTLIFQPERRGMSIHVGVAQCLIKRQERSERDLADLLVQLYMY